MSLWVTNSASVCRGKAGGGAIPPALTPPHSYLPFQLLDLCLSHSVLDLELWGQRGRHLALAGSRPASALHHPRDALFPPP